MKIELDEVLAVVGKLEAEAVARTCDPILERREGIYLPSESFYEARAWLALKMILTDYMARLAQGGPNEQIAELMAAVRAHFDKATPDQRLAFVKYITGGYHLYVEGCGGDDPLCQCENDE